MRQPAPPDASQAGVNSLLDVARQTYKEANADAAELVTKLAGKSSHVIYGSW